MSDVVRVDPRALPDVSDLVVGVLGGTGEQGRGLAVRLAMAGQRVVLGSRDAARAASVAAEIGHGVTGVANADCAVAADVVIVAVPWEGHQALLASVHGALADKVVVDCVNPLGFDAKGAYALSVDEGSAAEQAASVLPRSRVVGAFHHLSAVLLLDLSVDSFDTDVLVVGDDRGPPISCKRSPNDCRASVASTRAGCATPARSRPSPQTSSL